MRVELSKYYEGKNEILNFISKRWQEDCHWLNGNCLWFSLILKKRFPHLKIYYLPIEGHFVVKDLENVYYDWTGNIRLEEKPIALEEIKEQDPLWYKRLLRDCFY